MLGMNKQFGVREIANVVLKAKADMDIGSTKFKEGEPVLYFDTLKTSTVEGAATTVYATGGRGNARLVSWDGERTITFTMEDALISPMGLAILAGAGLVKADSQDGVAHFTERVTVDEDGKVGLNYAPVQDENNKFTYPVYYAKVEKDGSLPDTLARAIDPSEAITGVEKDDGTKYFIELTAANQIGNSPLTKGDVVYVDYYGVTGTLNIDIEPGKFSGNFYLEAATLFRDTDGKDHAAEFIIPNCRVQSNFTFTMAATGDPSTFTFTMDAFPGYTVYDKTKKVLCAIQVLDGSVGE